jgi:hypothetical protein
MMLASMSKKSKTITMIKLVITTATIITIIILAYKVLSDYWRFD